VLYYIRNKGVAFSMFNANGPLLLILVGVALAVIVYLYVRMINKGSLLFKLVFGLIIGGAVGNNLLDRLIRGSVVDFIFFRIPQINFNFAVFNLADAAISVGVVLLFVSLVISTVRTRSGEPDSNPLLQSQHIQEHDV
jgi:signal peptidase II